MKTCLIVTGGQIQMDFAGPFLEQQTFDLVIAVDGGLETVKFLGVIPDVVVGDFDTVDPQVFQEYHRLSHIRWEIHKPEKNETDTELAVHTAIQLGADYLTILGATGGRLDHMLANIHLLDDCHRQQVRAEILDAQNKVFIVEKGYRFERDKCFGKYISFVPLTEQVRGITLTGFKYPLREKDISIGKEAGLCISNELSRETGEIAIESGRVICIESRDFER